MDRLIIYFLPTIIALGAVTSYEDIKEGKIRNKYVIAGLALGLAIHITLYFSGFVDAKYLYTMAAYFLASLVIGVLLWMLSFWSAADAKLYSVFVLLTPPSVYGYSTTQLPFLDILFNAILIGFIYLFSRLVVCTSWRRKLTLLKSSLNHKVIAITLLSIFSISWLINLAYSAIGIPPPNYFLTLFILILVNHILELLFEEYSIYFLLVIGLLRVFVSAQYLLSISFLLPFAILTAGYTILSTFIRLLGTEFFENISIEHLKKGMILAEGITADYKKAEFNLRSIFKRQTFLVRPEQEGLSNRDILKIRKLIKKKALSFTSIRVQKTTPMAQFIFLGALLTNIFGGNIVLLLKNVF